MFRFKFFKLLPYNYTANIYIIKNIRGICEKIEEQLVINNSQNEFKSIIKLDDKLNNVQNCLNSNDIINDIEKINNNLDPFSLDVDIDYLKTIKPPMPITFNLATYVDTVPILQKFIDLGVKLYELEKDRNKAKYILKLDFEEHVKNHLNFLIELGLKKTDLGNFLTKNIYIFEELIENLNVRIEYLIKKKVKKEEICDIVQRYPLYLSYPITIIDQKLGNLQKEFCLKPAQVRQMLIRYPRLVALPKLKITETKFGLIEQMGFTLEETTNILINKPGILKEDRDSLVQRFDYIHNKMNIQQNLIAKFPDILKTSYRLIKERDLYLKKIGRNQYDPYKPLYVPLSAFYLKSDEKFVNTFCKTNLNDYDLFLKSL